MLSGIVKNIPGGRELEEFLDAFLAREVSTATLPAYLKDKRLRSITEDVLSGVFFNSPAKSSASAEAAAGEEDEEEEEGDAKPSSDVTHKVVSNYADLSDTAKELDKCLFNTLFTIVQGPYQELLMDLMGSYGRYTLGIIGMWKHAELGASSRRLTAMNQMQGLTFHGDAGKWKLEFLSSAREIYASKLTIEHFIMHCAFKSFEGKNTQVQGMMAQDINSPDVILPGMSLDTLASKYSSFVL